eukprot:scaffold961_cov51-Phaeocystis_antarctica.AAC.1
MGFACAVQYVRARRRAPGACTRRMRGARAWEAIAACSYRRRCSPASSAAARLAAAADPANPTRRSRTSSSSCACRCR